MGVTKASTSDSQRFERSGDMKAAGTELIDSGKALRDAGVAMGN